MIIATRRWRARGGSSESLEMVVVVAVPFGIIGARLYHVITDWQLYFGPGRDPLDALKIWNGGLGIWGAVALGVLGGYLVARRRKIRFLGSAGRRGPGHRGGPGHRPPRQLVQPGVVRTADHAAVGAGDRRRVPPGRLRGVRHLPPDVPVRVAVEPRRRRRADLGGPEVPARARQGLRPVRAAVHRRPLLDRGPPDRHRQRDRWLPAEQLHLLDRLRRRADLVALVDQVPARPRGRGRGRRADP